MAACNLADAASRATSDGFIEPCIDTCGAGTGDSLNLGFGTA